MIESISAIYIGHPTRCPRAVRFYRALGFEILHGGEDLVLHQFFGRGKTTLNLIARSHRSDAWSWWGRVIFPTPAIVDALHQTARARPAGYRPSTSPRFAEWGRAASSTSMTPDGP